MQTERASLWSLCPLLLPSLQLPATSPPRSCQLVPLFPSGEFSGARPVWLLSCTGAQSSPLSLTTTLLALLRR